MATMHMHPKSVAALILVFGVNWFLPCKQINYASIAMLDDVYAISPAHLFKGAAP